MRTLPERCHFIGIGGIGMSGLARILNAKGVRVSGSDLKPTPHLQALEIETFVWQRAENITEKMVVVVSSDIKKENPELQQAQSLGCEIWHRSELLALLVNETKGITVAGSHGKTTTSGLLTTVLKSAGKDPTFVVGGILPLYNTNAESGEGAFLVAEADESDGTHVHYHSYGAIITNLDSDHMDHYKTEAALDQSFRTFIEQVKQPELIVWCGDDSRLRRLAPTGTSYGFSAQNEAHVVNWAQEGWQTTFDFKWNGNLYSKVTIPMVGRHSILNALSVFIMCLKLGLTEEEIRKGLLTFSGVKRRCEIKGNVNGVTCIDDYAHHPAEIATVLHAVRCAERERRLVVIFQPHRYSRMQHCMGHFTNVFHEADELIITDIFASGEKPIPGVTTEKIVEEIAISHPRSLYIPRESLNDELPLHIKRHDVVITLGAGDVTQIHQPLLDYLETHPPHKIKLGLVCGGQSTEHEVSLLSCRNVERALNKLHYDIEIFKISKEGKWHLGDVNPIKRLDASTLEKLAACDVVFPVLHGPYGEDGTIQGFFEMLDIPHVGPCHRASAIAMDKIRTKKICRFHNIPLPDFVYFGFWEWRHRPQKILDDILEKMSFPLFVKGAHLGSSIGVMKVTSKDELESAIHKVFRVDTELLVEMGIEGRELEFPVLGNDFVRVFPPGEILANGEVYDYKAKYGAEGMKTNSKVELPQEVLEKGMELARKVYQATGCQGMARIDFFLDKQNQWWLNEVNPIPGFTDISIYPKGCEANGLPQERLMDQLVILGLHRQRKNRVLKYVNTAEWF